MMRYRVKKKMTPYLFILPYLFFFAVFMLYPFFYSLFISFARYKGGKFSFVGLANFQFLLSDDTFLKSIINTMEILIITIPIMTSLAVFLAVLMNHQRLKLKGMFRMFTFMPILIDAVSYSIIFGLFFSNDGGGLVNSLLGVFGVEPLKWMNAPWLAKSVIVIASTWRWTGYNVVMILGGLQNVSADLYEAAAVDGAGKFRQFLSVTLPGIKPVLTFSTVNSITGFLQLFTEPNLITHSGPSNETLTVVQYLYNAGFKQFNFGVSSAGAYVLAVMIGIFTFIQFKATGEEKG